MCVLVWVCDCVSPIQYEFLLRGGNTRTYMYRQTDRHSGWISETVATHSHTLEIRLSCGPAVGT
jgi:hypothetical protein